MQDRKKVFFWNRSLYLCLIILLLLFPVGAAYIEPAAAAIPPASGDMPDYSALEPYIDSAMKKNKVPGLSLAIFNDNTIEYSRGFGVKNAATSEPVDDDTIFEAASFSKTLTAYAALMLVEKGQLSLDASLNRYLKKEYIPDRKSADRITLRMVLTHTSGLSNASDGNDRKVYFTPGSYFSYSGAGFRYLQQVIEDVTGLPFDEFMDQAILKPLDMKSSSFVFKDQLAPYMANGHENGVSRPIAKMNANAAYSLLSTPTDMAKFNMEICHPTLLKPETVNQMLSPMVKWQKNIYWGLGMGLLKHPSENYFWHWGNNYYYCSIMITGRNSKRGLVIMTNGDTGMALAQNLALKIINDYFLDDSQDNPQKIDQRTFDFLL
jgi:Beta-lactamase class C and other penicillin binding proteins